MVLCPESDSLLFVGSPFLDGLDGLTSRGLFISDIPLHDATRDVILVGEQARAQVRSYTDLNHVACKKIELIDLFLLLYYIIFTERVGKFFEQCGSVIPVEKYV